MGEFSVGITGFVQTCLYSHQICNGLNDVEEILDKEIFYGKDDESKIICGE